MFHNLLPRLSRRKLLLFLIPAAAAFIAGCASNNPQDTFDTAGPVAEQQADLFKFIFWIAVVVFIIVEGGIIWITLKYRSRSDSDEMPVQTHGNTKLELTWTFIPTLIIIAIAIPTVIAIWDLAEAPADEPSMTVEAIGHQWWFEFRYPEEEVVTANELRVPVGKNVIVKLESQDVIHSFWVPKLFGKVDMVPNRDNELWFRADEPGVFYGQCAEFCGVAHGLMRFRVIAEPAEDYEAWVAGMQRPPAAPTGAAVDGQRLFGQHCSSCHTIDSYREGAYTSEISLQDGRWQGWLADIENASIVSAPNLTHFGTRLTIGAGIRDLDRQTLVEWIEDPGNLKPETRMEEHALVYKGGKANLTNDEIGAIADFLLSLRPVSADAEPTPTPVVSGDPVEVGQAVFVSNCASCHSTGSDSIVGPGLAGIAGRAPGGNADSYIKESIVEPGAIIADGYQNIMPSSFGSSLSTEQIAGLVAYLKTLN